LRDLAAVIDGQPAEHADFTLGDAIWANAKEENREWVRERTVPGRADGLEQALLDMIAADELGQAIGRARLVRRPLAGVAIDILTNHPVPGLAVNELLKLEEMMRDHDAEALAATRGIVFKPGSKGYWGALEAVTGALVEASKKASKRARAPTRKIALKGDRSLKEDSLIKEMSPLRGELGKESCGPPPGPLSTARGHSALVLRLLASGIWTQWRLRLPGKRYAIPVQVRASDHTAAEALVRRFFPDAMLEPVDTPKRRRGRPERGPSQRRPRSILGRIRGRVAGLLRAAQVGIDDL
jgi:hypothetical protein